jgi:hypothetical protein
MFYWTFECPVRPVSGVKLLDVDATEKCVIAVASPEDPKPSFEMAHQANRRFFCEIERNPGFVPLTLLPAPILVQ